MHWVLLAGCLQAVAFLARIRRTIVVSALAVAIGWLVSVAVCSVELAASTEMAWVTTSASGRALVHEMALGSSKWVLARKAEARLAGLPHKVRWRASDRVATTVCLAVRLLASEVRHWEVAMRWAVDV